MSPEDESPDIVRFTPLVEHGGGTCGDGFDFRKLRDLPTPILGIAAGNTDCNSDVDSASADISDIEPPPEDVGDIPDAGGRGLINEDDPPECDLLMPPRDNLDLFLLRKLRDLPGVFLLVGNAGTGDRCDVGFMPPASSKLLQLLVLLLLLGGASSDCSGKSRT